ncbi:hypothetical protein SMC26_37405 [Actinomadura fulvescens]|uniref:Uncharacterized protein n=1 Tax=Actinomadura fulvescens TaxID=46160 RepID=A0ABP6C162_9ACTN
MSGRHTVTEARVTRRRGRAVNLGLLLPLLVVLGTIAVVAIGLLTEDEDRDPRQAGPTQAGPTPAGPATPAPSTAKPAKTTAKAPGTGLAGARSTLQAWLRALGRGDASACDRYVTKAFAESRFGSMAKCRWHAKNITKYNSAKEVQALKTAVVRGGTVEADGRVWVDFTDLAWTSGHMTARTTERKHILRWDGDSWVLG